MLYSLADYSQTIFLRRTGGQVRFLYEFVNVGKDRGRIEIDDEDTWDVHFGGALRIYDWIGNGSSAEAGKRDDDAGCCGDR